MKNITHNIKNIFIWICGILLASIPFYNLIIKGVYNWHIQQPEVVLGGIEVIIFWGISVATLFLKSKEKSIGILFVMVLLYLSTNGVIIPVLVDYIYLEILLYVGFSFASFFSKCYTNRFVQFVCGISVWGSGAIVLSLIKHGTISELRWYTVLLLFIALLLPKKQTYSLLVVDFYKYLCLNKQNKFVWFVLVSLIFIICILFAKTNSAQDYDSLWYGLRPEYVLVGENSFYDNLGYTAFVYYYPKMMELLFLPISGLGDYSFIISMNVWIMVLLCLSIYSILQNLFKEESKKKDKLIWLFVLAISSIPAICNIAVTAKPDILGCFLVIVSNMFFLQYIIFKDAEYWHLAFVSLLLCTGTKETYLLWGGLSFLFYIFWTVVKTIKKYINIRNLFTFKNLFFWLIVVFFTFGIHFRTYILTGYPIYPIGINFMNKLGFSAVNGMKDSQIVLSTTPLTFMGVVKNIYYYIFNPTNLSHVVMLWTSNILVLMILILVSYFTFKRIKFSIVDMYVIIITGVMLFYMCSMSQPDGNYFIFPIIMVFIYCIYKICNMCSDISIVRITSICPIILVNLLIMFISHPSWAYGTHIPTKEVLVSNFETKTVNEDSYQYNGYANIAKYIEENMETDRIISSYIDYTLLGRFPAAIESSWELQSNYLSAGNYFDTYDSFESYIESAQIKGIMIMKTDDSVLKDYTIQYISKNGYICEIDDQSAVLYQLSE